MKRADAMATQSVQRPNLISLRGPKGPGHNDSIHEHLTAAGFEPGDMVSVILTSTLETLLEAGRITLANGSVIETAGGDDVLRGAK
jgi:hypothetical protein